MTAITSRPPEYLETEVACLVYAACRVLGEDTYQDWKCTTPNTPNLHIEKVDIDKWKPIVE